MFVAYDGIVFDVLLLNHWDMNAITSDDGADFFYWHHLIDATVILNPAIVAGDILPQQEFLGMSAKLKSRKKQDDARMRTLAGNDSRLIGERPNKSPIPLIDSISASVLPIASGTSFFRDNVGTASQKTGTTPSYPPTTNISPGLQYAADLASKTGPVEESTGGNWEDNNSPVIASPASVEETFTQYASDPVGALGPQRNLAVDALLGSPRPAPPVNQPGPNTIPKDPPPRGPRVRWPANPNVPATDIELRDRLQVPRRKLMVWINSGKDGAPEFILNLPYDGCTSDAKHGPSCKNASTIAIHGNVTGVKRLVFECFEALPLFYGPGKTESRIARVIKERDKGGKLIKQVAPAPDRLLTPPLISNRWTMKQVPDPQTKLNMTVITGKAVFRMDVLSNMNITADQLRGYMMPPIPTGYVRRPPEVEMGSGGNEVIYRVVDDQQMMNNPSGRTWGVHSVVVVDSVTANNPLDAFGPVFRAEKR